MRGTCNRPNEGSCVCGRFSKIMPTLMLLFGTCGNGCTGSIAIGVSAGKISLVKYSSSAACSLGPSSLGDTSATPSRRSSGRTTFQIRYCSVVSSCARSLIAASCFCGVMPSAVDSSTSPESCASRPAARTMKNSSRLDAKMARNLARSYSGTRLSSASARTRALNSSHDSSRLM